MARVILLVTSPRLPAGLLTAAAWQALRTHAVFAGAESELTAVVRAAGAEVTIAPPTSAVSVLLDAAAEGAVWLSGPAGDETLARELGTRLAREPGRAELELMYGSWDPPGARLLDVVSVTDRLVSPGGDPWKREQTHQTLAHFLLEEAYEAYDAIVADDLAALREELGDVLLQVVLHARMAEEAESPWSVDDLAGDLTAKLIRRNPHVFAGEEVADVDQIVANWERIKREEKSRDSAMDGIALAQPALALAAKILSRARRAGVAVPLPPLNQADEAETATEAEAETATEAEAALGVRLLHLVADAQARGLDAEAALRRAALAHAEMIRVVERQAGEPLG